MLNPPDVPGGTRHYTLARILVKMGYEVTLFASGWHHPSKQPIRLQDGESWAIEEIDGVRFLWLRTFPYWQNDWRRVVNTLSYLFQAFVRGRQLVRGASGLEKPDVVIGSRPHVFAALAAYLLARQHKAHFLVEVRDLWPQTLVELGVQGRHHPSTLVMQSVGGFLYRRAERIVSLLRFGHRYLAPMGIPAEKVVWIPNGVDLSLYEGVLPPPAKGLGEPFVCMYAGALGVMNELDLLLDAAAILQGLGREDIRFVFVGDGPERDRLHNRRDQLALEQVEFRDAVSKDQLPDVLAEADAFIMALRALPVYKYGISPNKLFDYLCANRPLIFVGIPENDVATEAGCGVSAPPADPQALASAICCLADTPLELRREMAHRGRAYVETHHDLTLLAGSLARVIDEVCAE